MRTIPRDESFGFPIERRIPRKISQNVENVVIGTICRGRSFSRLSRPSGEEKKIASHNRSVFFCLKDTAVGA